MTDKEFNIFEYIQEKMKIIEAELGTRFLEGVGYDWEWDAIVGLLFDIDKFLKYLNEKEGIR
jgi:hypothetical protein